MVRKKMDKKQFRILTILMILAVLFGIYFLRPYFTMIALAAIVAFLTNPIYKWCLKRFKRVHLSLWMTFLISLVIVIIPVALVLIITVEQAISLINTIISGNLNIQQIINNTNQLIDKIPGESVPHLTVDQIVNWVKDNTTTIGKSAATIVFGVAGGFASFFIGAVVFVYVYLSLLRNQTKILSGLNRMDPLGNKTTHLYLEKMGAMTSAMVKGQFVIAMLQGLTSALLLWIVGFNYFIFWFVFITFLSIIPLGGGIIIIPIGIVMILTGNIWQGVLLIVGHIVIVTNIDNVLRPRFVPKEASIDPALTMLGVFAGLAMFGFLGIIIGPIIMIVLVTTIQMYLHAIKKKETLDQIDKELSKS